MANEQDKLNIDGIIQRLLECKKKTIQKYIVFFKSKSFLSV
jgi:hypothetical protein